MLLEQRSFAVVSPHKFEQLTGKSSALTVGAETPAQAAPVASMGLLYPIATDPFIFALG